MVLNNDPNRQRIRANEERLNQSEDEVKDKLLNQLRDESLGVLTLAYVYAKNFEEVGIDITKRWQTAQEQNAILQQVYNQGYEDGLYRRGEEDKIKAERKKEIKSETN